MEFVNLKLGNLHKSAVVEEAARAGAAAGTAVAVNNFVAVN